MKYKVVIGDTTIYHIQIDAASEEEALDLVTNHGWNKDEELASRQTERVICKVNIVEDHDGE